MKTRMTVLVGAVLVAMFSVGLPTAVASEKIPIAAEVVDFYYPQEPVETAHGRLATWSEVVVQLRFETVEFLAGSEYLAGPMDATVHVTFHMACTAEGCDIAGGGVQGTWSLPLDSIAGGWTGTAAGGISGMAANGDLVYTLHLTADGWGELAGWHLQATSWHDPVIPGKWYSGYVVPPGD